MTVARAVATRTRVATLLGVGGGLTLLASSRPWVVLSAEVGLTPTTVDVTGAALAPVAAAAGVVGLAAVLAVLAARVWGRRVVGVLVVVVAGAGLAQVLAALTDPPGRARAWWAVEVGAAADSATATPTPWPAVCALALVLLAASGVLVLVGGATWAGLSGRYESPGRTAGGSEDAWRVLDDGRDPTVEDDRGG